MSEVILAGYKTDPSKSLFGTQIVKVLPSPESAIENTLYLVEKNNSNINDNYDEYLYIKSKNTFERVGDNIINISDAEITLDHSYFFYDGNIHEPTVQSLRVNNIFLTKNVDYICLDNSQTNVGSYSLRILGIGKYGGVFSTPWEIRKASGSITLESYSVIVPYQKYKTIKATIVGDGSISFSGTSNTTISKVEEGFKIYGSKFGGTDTITITLNDGTNYIGTKCTLTVEVDSTSSSVYGVIYSGTADTKLTRIGGAALFDDPVASVKGSAGYSPFDYIEPWSGIKKVEQSGNSMVAIPKFYYKYTALDNGGFKLEISKTNFSGAHVSPAHANRGDTKGERETVYIGRYPCNTEYKSVSGTKLLNAERVKRSDYRTNIKKFGTGWYMLDWPMIATIQMLYLVEFANFDYRNVIGYAYCLGGDTQTLGITDNMPYHTGTTGSSRTDTSERPMTQYRWIEMIFHTMYGGEIIDGVNINEVTKTVYASLNVNSYSDSTSGYTQVCTIPLSETSGSIKSISFSTTTNFEWVYYPKELTSETGYMSSSYDCSNDSDIKALTYGNSPILGGIYDFSTKDLDPQGISGSGYCRPIYLP